MREIKFRAWHEAVKIMIDLHMITPFALNINTDGLFIPFSDGIHLMQYTGLKDKNGKEIYEGDIVEDKFILTIMEPHEKRTEYPFEVKIPDIYYRQEFNGYDFKESFEIIGNIYETDFLP